jgi:hypothetical protein
MWTSVVAKTPDVVIGNVAVVWPDATVTVDGTVAAPGVSELSEIVIPPNGASTAMPTVPVDIVPPTNTLGRIVSPVTFGGVIVNAAVLVIAPYVTLTVAGVFTP